MQLRQLFELSSSVLCDGGGSNAPGHLIEQLIDGMHSSGRCPIQKLIFYNASLDVAHAVKLSHLLNPPSSCVVSLVLGNIPLRVGALVALAGALCHGFSKLEQLVLEGCGIGSVGVSALFEALCHNKSLWKLDLSRNHVSDSVCSALGQLILANGRLTVSSLHRISVFSTRISLLGRAALQLAATHFNCLRATSTSNLDQSDGRSSPTTPLSITFDTI